MTYAEVFSIFHAQGWADSTKFDLLMRFLDSGQEINPDNLQLYLEEVADIENNCY